MSEGGVNTPSNPFGGANASLGAMSPRLMALADGMDELDDAELTH